MPCSELYWRRSIKSLKMPFSEFQGTLVQKVMGLIRKAMGMDTKIKIVLPFMNRWTLEVADDQSSQMIRLEMAERAGVAGLCLSLCTLLTGCSLVSFPENFGNLGVVSDFRPSFLLPFPVSFPSTTQSGSHANDPAVCPGSFS